MWFHPLAPCAGGSHRMVSSGHLQGPKLMGGPTVWEVVGGYPGALLGVPGISYGGRTCVVDRPSASLML